MKHQAGFRSGAVLLALCFISGAAAAAGMSIQSTAFDNGQPIPTRYSCDGAGVSPPLKIAGVPGKAGSLVLIVDDPDAPSGTWVHWVLYNLAPDAVALAPQASERALPGPISTADNSFHKSDYGAVCPPRGNGVHHYRFTLYALDTRLAKGLADKSAVREAMQGHVIAKTRLTGTYQRH